mmetsp:Transcript_114895/g.199075  ORF Transcript_114895/g.199075 Transcript_114895/m.199075 type:complete len:441 (-) Transcript_114895:432-1754(-)
MAGCRKRSPSEEPPLSSKHAKAAGGCSYKFETLKREIIARSIADDWEQARQEWTLEHVYRKDHDAPGTCLCTHYPIIEVCVMAHDNNGKEVNVGNCCVKKFFQLPSDTIFAAVRRIQQDRDKALNTATIDFAYEHDWISDWDYQFYMDTFRKRKLSERQHEQRERINAKILDRTSTCKASDEDGDGNLWLLDKMVLDEAHEQGRISRWEVDFYAGNYGKDCVTMKQLPIKQRIEEKIADKENLGIAWPYDADTVAKALELQRITQWEADFYINNMGKAQLSDKQSEVKNRVDGKLSQPPQHSTAYNCMSWPMARAEVDKALAENCIDSWEHGFYTNTAGKATLSEKQQIIKERIETKIAKKFRMKAASSTAVPSTRRGQHPIVVTPTVSSAAAPHNCMPISGTGFTLSAEQRERIEKNRLAALERRRLREMHSQALGTCN